MQINYSKKLKENKHINFQKKEKENDNMKGVSFFIFFNCAYFLPIYYHVF